MADAMLKRFNSENHTFLSKRFDRTSVGNRVHFASAMTLLQRQDGDDASSGVSYLHLAEFLMREGAQPEKDSVAAYFRVSKAKADSLISEMLKIIKDWRKIATNLGINQSEQTHMASAFKIAD